MELPEKVPTFLPITLEKDANGPTLLQFAENMFSTIKVGGLFSKKTLSNDEAITFSKEASNDPLLKKVTKNHYKQARLLQKGIMKIIGARNSKHFKGTPGDLILMAADSQELIDEGYAVLIRLTNGSKEKIYTETMKMLALWGKYLKPSSEIAPYILAQLARECKRTDLSPNALSSAQFAYIRVSGRFLSHYETKPTKDKIEKSINDIDNKTICFNATLEEIMWHQKLDHPKLFFPHVITMIVTTLIQEGGLKSEGIFRLPGNATRVNECPGKANNGETFLKGLDTKDLATLLKQWFRTLEVNVIPDDFAEKYLYKERKTAEEVITIANELPLLQKCTLMYLIGFLKELSQYESENSMSAGNLAMTFAMSIAYISEDVSTSVNTRLHIQYFIEALIQNWDVSAIYPVPSSMQ